MKKRITAGTGASLGTLLALPAAAQADDFRVTNLNTSGSGSLEAAVEAAYDNDGADRILFKSKLSGTINTTDGAEALYIGGGGGDLEIIGPGARKLTLSGSNGYPALIPWATFSGEPGADVTISGLRIADSDNDSAYFGAAGGGLQIFGDMDVTLERVTIAGNSADADGGGIAVLSAGTSPSLVIENSTISGNQGGTAGGDYGGGIYVENTDFTLLNSTVSGNSAGEDGGGVYITGGSDAELRSSTITGNSAETNDAGGVYAANSDLEVRGTIIANNTADSASYTDLRILGANSYEFSFSLIGDPDNQVISGSSNLLDVDPNLKPLKNNGGPTDTHAFKKSPAKNKVPKSESEKKDQRGAPRKGKGDIGAYELVKCEGVIVNRVGTGKKDKLKGTKRRDGILGLGGNDRLSGKKGRDGLCGGKGKDKLKGGPGKDKLDGGPGKDREVQ
jgi:Right handed beta helix region/RTX calcium-binding nonapeptide repeat (4 copies)